MRYEHCLWMAERRRGWQRWWRRRRSRLLWWRRRWIHPHVHRRRWWRRVFICCPKCFRSGASRRQWADRGKQCLERRRRPWWNTPHDQLLSEGERRQSGAGFQRLNRRAEWQRPNGFSAYQARLLPEWPPPSLGLEGPAPRRAHIFQSRSPPRAGADPLAISWSLPSEAVQPRPLTTFPFGYIDRSVT